MFRYTHMLIPLRRRGVENKLGLLAAPAFALSYAAIALFLVCCHFYVGSVRNPWITGSTGGIAHGVSIHLRPNRNRAGPSGYQHPLPRFRANANQVLDSVWCVADRWY